MQASIDEFEEHLKELHEKGVDDEDAAERGVLAAMRVIYTQL
jgi:hypothetical protein